MLEEIDPLRQVKPDSLGLVHPFYFGDTLIGTLTVGKTVSRVPFSAAQTNVVHTFADFLAIQIVNARFQAEQVNNLLMARDLQIAKNIQRNLLVKTLPQLTGFGLAGYCESARQVGGDFYDVVKLSDHSLLMVIADVMGYWAHRAHHTFERLWQSHAVHHSSTELNWLSSVRVHPFNEALQNAAIASPLILLGFQPGTVAVYLPFLTFYAIFVHANVRWDFGPLRYVIATPAFHRWHHSAEADALNKNFAGLFPVTDWLFGTLYLPKGVQPSRFGVNDLQVPGGFLAQLAFPVRRRGMKRDQAPSGSLPATA